MILHLYALCLGLCMGSFMNVLIYRLPRDLSIVRPPSHCTSCGERVRFYDNIPVISWILLRGRCRFCSSEISFMYPVTEILTGVLVWYSFYRFGLTAQFIHAVLLILVMVSAGLADLFSALDTESFECGIIPDSLIVFGIGGALLMAYIVREDVRFAVYGAAVGFMALFIPALLYRLIRKREGMGFGDIKLVAVAGAFLGVKSIFFVVFASALMGAVIGIIWQFAARKRDIMIPFGPFISAAALIYLFFETTMDKLLYGI
ncbi:peptidase A24A domain protein [Denitrovibrio acetiphilus DSM 12809]|uniref:Prepilin leader peptidase/N-methyltransferase n=2 Tax=Denitrovibrio TaxID=117999 RepID=D4H327_DENA2|nr:peptidase A24A domain protein [Denitrovibrio acetiphilus DSM 12809]